MSTLKVSSIQNASTSSGGVSIDTSGHVTVDGVAMPSTGPLSNRNKIINGDMRIDQRNAGASKTITDASYTLDRWRPVTESTGSVYSVQQNAGSVTPPTGFTNYLGITTLSAQSVSGTNTYTISQYIEGFNVSDLAWGTASAVSVTLSFWVRSSLTGTFGGSLQNSSENRSYPFTYSISAANTWQQKTITVPGDTTGTWLTNNGIGMRLTFGLGVGATRSGTAGSWAASDFRSATGATSVVGTNGATFYLTGVQLEAGSVATPFERRSFGAEFDLCERYYQKSYELDTKPGTTGRKGAVGLVCANGGSGEQSQIRFSTRLRADPTFKFYNHATGAIDSIRNESDQTNSGPAYNEISQTGFTGGPTSPQDGKLFFYHYIADAEL